MRSVKVLNDFKSTLKRLTSFVALNRPPAMEEDAQIGVENSKTFLQLPG